MTQEFANLIKTSPYFKFYNNLVITITLQDSRDNIKKFLDYFVGHGVFLNKEEIKHISVNYNNYVVINKDVKITSHNIFTRDLRLNEGKSEFLYKKIYTLNDFRNKVIENILKYGVEIKTPNYLPKKLDNNI